MNKKLTTPRQTIASLPVVNRSPNGTLERERERETVNVGKSAGGKNLWIK